MLYERNESSSSKRVIDNCIHRVVSKFISIQRIKLKALFPLIIIIITFYFTCTLHLHSIYTLYIYIVYLYLHIHLLYIYYILCLHILYFILHLILHIISSISCHITSLRFVSYVILYIIISCNKNSHCFYYNLNN